MYMSMSMHMYMYMYTYIYTHITYIYTYIYIHRGINRLKARLTLLTKSHEPASGFSRTSKRKPELGSLKYQILNP